MEENLKHTCLWTVCYETWESHAQSSYADANHISPQMDLCCLSSMPLFPAWNDFRQGNSPTTFLQARSHKDVCDCRHSDARKAHWDGVALYSSLQTLYFWLPLWIGRFELFYINHTFYLSPHQGFLNKNNKLQTINPFNMADKFQEYIKIVRVLYLTIYALSFTFLFSLSLKWNTN